MFTILETFNINENFSLVRIISKASGDTDTWDHYRIAAKMKYVLKLLVLGLLGNSAFAGLLNIFSASSDYNAAQLMDSLFGAIYNTTELIVNGGSSNPLSVDITFWCGNRYVDV